jgi:hypothetical protein
MNFFANRQWLGAFCQIVGSTPTDILFGLSFDVLSRQRLGAFWQIVGSTPTVILFAPRRKSEPRQIGGRVTRHVVAVVFLSDSN